MFCGSNSGSKEEKAQAVGVYWPDEAKTKEAETDGKSGDANARKNEKRKLQQDIKAVEAEKRAVAKQLKKVVQERNSILNKRKAYIRSKDENNRLQEKINKQKNIWLNQASRKKDQDGEAVLNEVAGLISRLVEVQKEANIEWDNINKFRAAHKEQNIKMKWAKKQLETDWTKLKEDRADYVKRTNECNNLIKDTEAEQARLKELRADIDLRTLQADQNSKRNEQLDLALKNRMTLITQQEMEVRENETELKEKNAIVDDIKKNIYFSLEQKRAALNDKFSRLAADYFKWASVYSQVVESNAQEDQCIVALKEAELAVKRTQIQKPEVFQVAEDLKEFEGQVLQEAKESGSEKPGEDNQPQDAGKLKDISGSEDPGNSGVGIVNESTNNGELDFMAALEAEVAKKLYPEKKMPENDEIYRELTPNETNLNDGQHVSEGKEDEQEFGVEI